MSERTGLGVVEVALLGAVESSGFTGCGKALARVGASIGLAPGYAYEVLADLARRWTMPVGLVDGMGNFGSRSGDPPAHFRYTQARISAAGRVALAAERGELAPVPIGLINGNAHREGLRPPFRPRAVLGAVREVLTRPKVPAGELAGLVGLPSFPTGCQVTGDLGELAAGRRTDLRLQAQVTIDDHHRQVIIENIPPNITTSEVAITIADRAARPRPWAASHPGLHCLTDLPLADVIDDTTERAPFGRIICIPRPGTSPEELRDTLVHIPGVTTTLPVQLPRPMATMIRNWVPGQRPRGPDRQPGPPRAGTTQPALRRIPPPLVPDQLTCSLSPASLAPRGTRKQPTPESPRRDNSVALSNRSR